MSDNVTRLWESELLRAREWLAANRKDEQQENEKLFYRVKMHIDFKDHQRSLHSEALVSEDEDDIALDFLADVDASDMDVLLQAEAAKIAAAVPLVEIVPPVGSDMSTELMIPLEMPDNLVSPNVKSMLQLDSTDATIADAGVALGNEARVQELIQELALDVMHLKQFDVDEEKMEECTPPHILKNLGGKITTANDETRQFKYMQQVSSKSPQSPQKKKADSLQQDGVAKEMLSWVTGYRDPEVIRRKENMRQKRRYATRYGIVSEEKRRQGLLQVENTTLDCKDENESSESADDMGSNYSFTEDQQSSGSDEDEAFTLLSDDNLDSDEKKGPERRKRKRLRCANGVSRKKKLLSRKPIVTRKLTPQSLANRNIVNLQEVQVGASCAETEAQHDLVAAKCTSPKEDSTSTSSQLVHLHLSTEDEKRETKKRKYSISEVVKHKPTRSKAIGPETTKESIVLQDHLQKESDTSKEQQKHGLHCLTKADSVLTCSKAVIEDTTCDLVSIVFGPSKSCGSPTANEDASTDDTDLPDTGIIDVEGAKSSHDHQEHSHDAVIVNTTKAVTSSCPATEWENTAMHAKMVDNISHGGLKQSVEASDEDVSEAETEILEDDESDTDNLGRGQSVDSDSRSSIIMSQKTSSMDAQKDASCHEKIETETDIKTAHGRYSSSGCKQNASSNQKEKKVSVSTVGVQQFFDFAPLKLKPKVKTVAFAAQKLLPIHSPIVTRSNVVNSNVEDTSAKSKKTRAVPTTPSVGSNGLRPSRKPIATTTTKNGKYLTTRRCIKVLNSAPEAKQQLKRQHATVFTEKFKSGDTHEYEDVPLSMLAKELSKKVEDTPQTRYLSYAGAKHNEEPPSYVVETPRSILKSRFGGGLHSSSLVVQNDPAVSNGQRSQMTDTDASHGEYRREPQISIYDALHMDKQESTSDVCAKTDYKRSSRFKKMQEEADRTGTPIVKSQWRDKDWDKAPIPKKKKIAHQADEVVVLQSSNTSNRDSRTGAGRTQNKRCKITVVSSKKKSGPSYYGPQSSQRVKSGKQDSSMRERYGREHSRSRCDDDRKRKWSPSPPSGHRDLYDKKRRSRGAHRHRGLSRSRSHSPSPKSRDYSTNRNRHHSRSSSRSRDKSSERDRQRRDRTSPVGRDRDSHRKVNDKRQSLSPEIREPSEKKRPGEPPKLAKVCQNSKSGDIDRSTTKQKICHSMIAPPSPGALATFEDDGDNMFVSDSDDDEIGLIKEVEDIRVDLNSVPVDEALIKRQVYVSGLNPTVCAEQIEEDFARFGVGVDRETGFPAIEVFACQRNYLGRGDACVTFESEEGAQMAVEELNSKNVKNSMIHVRRMDIHTQRILTLQFQAVRDTWKCTKAQCRADVSVWNAKCDKCGRKRVYGPSNIKIDAKSWLCLLCFTANDFFATCCHGCMESLPAVDRSTFYTS